MPGSPFSAIKFRLSRYRPWLAPSLPGAGSTRAAARVPALCESNPNARFDRRMDSHFPEGLFREASDHGVGGGTAATMVGAEIALRSRSSLPPDGWLCRLPAAADTLDAADRGSG